MIESNQTPGAAQPEQASQPTQGDPCFCDRMYPKANPDASCGDCPKRDYKTQPTQGDAPIKGDELLSLLQRARIYANGAATHVSRTPFAVFCSDLDAAIAALEKQ